jgi:hypothetical protein
MDRAEIVSDSERVSAPAGTFEKYLHTLETSALEEHIADHKWYATGVGVVKDGKPFSAVIPTRSRTLRRSALPQQA